MAMQQTAIHATQTKLIMPFEAIRYEDVPRVGGKNASLGEMIAMLKEKGVVVPDGFATTAEAYREFLRANHLEQGIAHYLNLYNGGAMTLEEAGDSIRKTILQGEFPEALRQEIIAGYGRLCTLYRMADVDVAVRSSATAEDLPDASFAGQQDTYLNIRGADALLRACKECYASLFTDRAMIYREEKGFDHLDIALSIGIQKMVRSDLAGSGVLFTIDPESGFPDVVVINAAWGLGETIVQGRVNPDEYVVFKPLLNEATYQPILKKSLGSKEEMMIYAPDQVSRNSYTPGNSLPTEIIPTSHEQRLAFVLNTHEILQLSRWAGIIEEHYGRPMDIEWAKDGQTGELFIVQARPETVHSQKTGQTLKTFALKEQDAAPILTGISIGNGIATGEVCVIKHAGETHKFKDGAILVTEMTDPDWVPIMMRASGIVTNSGGRTCHAAIVSREFSIPAVVGTVKATETLRDGQAVTISCGQGDEGYVYEGKLDYDVTDIDLATLPESPVKLMLNVAHPSTAFQWWQLPVDGIGLARMEFIISNMIKIHPMALVHFDRIPDQATRAWIEELTEGYPNKTEYFVSHLAQGIATIAASQYPHPVIVRMSDFKTNEYENLVGGQYFEGKEANPMLGFRGASRYYSDAYREGFALECAAIRRVREEIGLTNVVIMIPFCRTLTEADQVIEVLRENGLERGKDGLEFYVMAEIPANIILAEEFAKRFDGFSIGSNDLTQLMLGVDRDSGGLSNLFDERDESVKRMIEMLLEKAKVAGCKVGICGQAPSDHPEFAEFLVKAGIDSISLNPDSIVSVKQRLAIPSS